MSFLAVTVQERLARAELLLLGALTSIALLVAIRSIENAVPGRTMWPSFFLEQAWPFISLQTVILVGAALGGYILARRAGRSRRAFWLAALMIIGAHMTAVWAHNQLDWHQMFGRAAVFAESEPLVLTSSLFLVTLAGLVLLHRIMQLRELADALSARGVRDAERDSIISNELLSIVVILATALFASTWIVIVGAVVASADGLAQRMPSAVSVVGMGAVIVFAGFLALLYRTLSGSETSPGAPLPDEQPDVPDPDAR